MKNKKMPLLIIIVIVKITFKTIKPTTSQQMKNLLTIAIMIIFIVTLNKISRVIKNMVIIPKINNVKMVFPKLFKSNKIEIFQRIK